MGLGSTVRGGIGLLSPRHHDIESMRANQTPSLAISTLWHRPREMPPLLTPFAVFSSLVQLDDLQALLWAWMLVGLILLIAFWSNPSDTSFRPFLTDFTFRERLRCLHEGFEADALLDRTGSGNGSAVFSDGKGSALQQGGGIGRVGGGAGGAFRGSLFSTSLFATTFGSKLSLSVRTPPYLRKDFAFFSVVTISHSMPLHYVGAASGHNQIALAHSASHDARKTVDTASGYTSVFIGAFGRYWTAVYGLPLQRLASTHSPTPAAQGKGRDREELEENRPELSDWGVLEMRSADHESATLVDPLIAREMEKVIEHRRASCMSDSPAERQSYSKRSRSRSSSPHSANRAAAAAVTVASAASSTATAVAEPESSDLLAMLTAVADSQSAVSDLQEQLKQLRANSTKSCEGLQGDVDDLRARKRDEDKARMEIKSRTKSLEESKRQVEQARREAERRSKAASTARSSRQTSIATKRGEIEALLKKRAGHQIKLQSSSKRKAERIAELHSLTADAQDRLRALKDEMSKLRADVQTAEDTLSMEKDNLQAAYDGQLLREREHGKAGFAAANGGFVPHLHPLSQRNIGLDPFGPLDPAGRGAPTPYDGFSGPYFGPPPPALSHQQGFPQQHHHHHQLQFTHRQQHQQYHPIPSHGSPYGPFSDLPDVGRGFGQFAQSSLLTERVEDIGTIATSAKSAEGLGASVLRKAFRKATDAAPFAPKSGLNNTIGPIGSASVALTEDGLDAGGVSKFEAMKQAFQPTLASEEEGRRSWSAFDVWQSDMRDARHHRLHWSHGVNNSSADSLPQFHHHASSSSSNLVPHDRSNSAGYAESIKDDGSISNGGNGGDAEQTRNMTKVKRAFRWPFRPSQIQGEVI